MRSARDIRKDEAGQALAIVIALVALIITSSAITVIALAGSVTSSRISSNEEVARASAVSAARMFAATLNNTRRFPTGITAALASNVFPKGLNVTPHSWYKMGPSGLTSCTETRRALEVPCVRITDRLQKLSYTPKGVRSNTALASPYAVNLEVTVRSDCLVPGNPPVGCQMNRLEERIAPRIFTDYVEFDNSEFLDPLLVLQGYPSIRYTNWYDHCTVNGKVKGDLTSSIFRKIGAGLTAAPDATTCLVPAYLGKDAYGNAFGTTSGDVVNGPIGTNDTTVFVCGHGSTQPTFDEKPVAAGTPPTAEYPLPVGDGVHCTGTPPPGQSKGRTPLPRSDSVYKTLATPADTYSSNTEIALCGTLSSNTYSEGTATNNGSSNVGCGHSHGQGAQEPWPSTGVIYVIGTAYVSGTICQSGVTIAATGNIFIVDNLINERLHGHSTACSGSIGLVAGRAVVITPGEAGEHCPSTGVGPCQGHPSAKTARIQCWNDPYGVCQIVDAAVMALGDNTGSTKVPTSPSQLGGSFYERGWDSLLPPATASKKTTTNLSCGPGVACVMQLTGSITENFRGAFGTYTVAKNGPQLETGIAKVITFDPVLATQQPPYFLHPQAGIWQQEGLTYTGALQS